VHQRGVDAQPAGHLVAGGLRVLRGAPQRQPAVLAPRRGGRARLQRGRGEPLVVDLPRDDDLAAVEQGVVERLLVEGDGDVRAGLGEEQHLPREALLHVDDGGQRVVVDLDEVGRVLTLVGLLGEHGGDGLADEPHPVGGQPRPDHGLVRPAEEQGRRQVDVGAGDDVGDARRLPSALHALHGDRRVRQGGPDEGEVQGTGQPLVGEVVGVGGAAREEQRVLRAHHSRAHDAHRGRP
jgi:hypothetical protein